MALFRDHPGEPLPEENFRTLWCKGRLTETDTLTIRLGATPSRLTSTHLHNSPPIFYRPDALPAAQPTLSKHWRQLAHLDFGEDARVLLNSVTCTVSVPWCYAYASYDNQPVPVLQCYSLITALRHAALNRNLSCVSLASSTRFAISFSHTNSFNALMFCSSSVPRFSLRSAHSCTQDGQTQTHHNITPPPPHHNHFTALFPGPPRSAGATRQLLDFTVQGKINRGRHSDHPTGRHSIRTNQSPPPPSPHVFYRPDALPATQPTVSKHWRQPAHSD